MSPSIYELMEQASTAQPGEDGCWTPLRILDEPLEVVVDDGVMVGDVRVPAALVPRIDVIVAHDHTDWPELVSRWITEGLERDEHRIRRAA